MKDIQHRPGRKNIGPILRSRLGSIRIRLTLWYMAILAVVALLSEFLITALERRLLSWRPNTVSDVTI